MRFKVMCHRPRTQMLGEDSMPRELCVATLEQETALAYVQELRDVKQQMLEAGWPYPGGKVGAFQTQPNDSFYLVLVEELSGDGRKSGEERGALRHEKPERNKSIGYESTSWRPACSAVEEAYIEDQELRSLGHRIIFDTKTGWSRNIWGCHCDPSKLDENGYQVRL